ncbi:MAG: hypothetical protein ACFFD3_04600 [Candidatus Thorarchaeota archaeon]
MSCRNFEAGLARQYESVKDKHDIDVTLYMQMMFESSDRHIARATLQQDGSMVVIAGLRSEILSPFPRYKEGQNGSYRQCDIPGLIPAIALLVEQQNRMISASAIERDDATRIILIFEGSSIEELGRNIWRFMDRWATWTRVLLNILEKDLPFNIDWREFLAGESGYVTMDWYRPLDYETRSRAIDRVRLASKALLQSVLSRTQFEKHLVQEILNWLDDMQPQNEVVGTFNIIAQEEVV